MEYSVISNQIEEQRCDLLAAQERHPQGVQQFSPVLLGEGAGVGDEGRGEEDVPTKSLLLLVVLSHRVGPAHVFTLTHTIEYTVHAQMY